MAEPNHILLGPALAETLAQYPAFRLAALQPVDVRGFGMTTPRELHRAIPAEDPNTSAAVGPVQSEQQRGFLATNRS